MIVALLVSKYPWLSLLSVVFYSWLCNTDGAVRFHCSDGLLWVLPFSRLRDAT